MSISDEVRNQAPKGFDPHEYVHDGGWGWDSIVATAQYGVSEEDQYRLRDYYDDAAQAAVTCLHAYCQARVVDERAATCDGCGTRGYHTETSAGELVLGGAVIAQAPAESTILMVGREDGSDTDGVYCMDCATVS